MNFTEGLEKALLHRDYPIVTYYDFFILGHGLFIAKVWGEEPLKRMPQGWDQTRAKNAIKRLETKRVITADTDFRSNVWRVTQATRAGTAEEVACIADPFSYVSHLSAMQKYGLTDRNPQALHMTTPKRAIWNTLRNTKVGEDLPDVEDIEKPVLNRPGFKETIRRRPVIVHVSSQPWTTSPVSDEQTRITSIGQTFADMLTEPGLCGGIRHVLDVWEREAEPWAEEIIKAVDQLDSKIAKVRAGYILTEVMDIDHPAIHNWEQYAQRGGSRKLDPDAEYAPVFSEKWMISINV
jgi:predicted transcriptional regulator of viral defense system